MRKPISQFFADLGYALKNKRWSWGASRDGVIVLRTWSDGYSPKERRVTVLSDVKNYQDRDSYGLDERIRHLRSLWNGEAAGYTVIATAVDPAARPREIKDYRDDKVFVIERLELRDDGTVAAALSGLVAFNEFQQHAGQHRTSAAEGPFPADLAVHTGISTDNLAAKLPAMREWLIEVARRKGKVTYGEVMDRFGILFFVLRTAMSQLGRQCQLNGEPIITALIVDKDSGLCSDGLQDEFGVADDELEREHCYLHWASQPQNVPYHSLETYAPAMEERIARFSKVEIRPQQAAFRRAVFLACHGRCVISGCEIPEALEAAHLEGRQWRNGHNTGKDGILLRRDLHALYDCGLLKLSDEGLVQLDPKVHDHYKKYDNVRVAAVL